MKIKCSWIIVGWPTENSIIALKVKSIEDTQTETWGEKRSEEIELSIKRNVVLVKMLNLYVIGNLEGDKNGERENGIETIFEQIISNNFSKLVKISTHRFKSFIKLQEG